MDPMHPYASRGLMELALLERVRRTTKRHRERSRAQLLAAFFLSLRFGAVSAQTLPLTYEQRLKNPIDTPTDGSVT